MLEKKGRVISVHSSGQEGHQLLDHPVIEELPEDGEKEGGLTPGGNNSPSSNKSNSSSIFHQNDTKGDDSNSGTGVPCGSSVITGKRQQRNKDSFHSSDEIIDEEDLLEISDTDNDIPIIPGMISTLNTSDVDSAFEDSVYSGSSDDKNKIKGSCPFKTPVLKNKNRRKSGGRSGDQHQYIEEIVPGTRIQDCITNPAEMAGNTCQKPDSVYMPVENLGNDQSCDHEELLSGRLQKFEHLNEPEPTLFDMEVSPREVMPGGINPHTDSLHNVYQDFRFAHLTNSQQPKSNSSNRRVHYSNEEEFTEKKDLTYSDEEDNDYGCDGGSEGHLDTILLPPPLDMNVQISPPGSPLINSPLENFESVSTEINGPTKLLIESGDKVLVGNMMSPSICSTMAETQKMEAGESKLSNGAPAFEACSSPRRSLNPTGGDTHSNSENGDFEVVYVVPDGGWGWMVLFGSILVNILIPGTVKSFGILFVEFLEVFDASPAAAAWIPALSYWLYSSMGPFAGALALKYSHRSVTIVGGLLASLGLMLSYFATSISYLYVSYGLIGGLGAGLAYPIGVFMVGQYFEKRRGLANGLCTSGSALGSVLVPPLLRVLLSEYGYRGAILIMGAILLNVCVGAMFYDPISKHMKKQLIPREKPLEQNTEEPQSVGSPSRQLSIPQRQVTNPIPRTVRAPIREVAASMPIAIPFPQQAITDFRDAGNRRGSNSGRKATFQIGHEEDSWSYKSNELGSPLTTRLGKEDQSTGANSPNRWTFYNPRGITVRGHLPSSNNDSNPELETLINSANSGAMPTSVPSGTALSLSGVVASRGQSRLNLTAIPEDDDTASESASRQVDWNYYSALPAAKQRLLRLSVSGGTQLMGSGSNSAHPSTGALVNQPGLTRTMSVASNVSNSSFHYMSTIHHGSLLTAMQYDKHLPEFASTLTLKSVRDSCCPSLTTLKGICRKVTCGLWPKTKRMDEQDAGIVREGLPLPKVKRTFSDKIKKFIDLSLLKDGMYLIMLISNSTTAVGYTNFIVLLPSYALAMGFDKSEAAFLLSIVAALDFVGRIGGAALSDLQFVSRRWYYIIGLFLSGVALSFLPCAKTFTSLVAMCSAFGLASGVYIGVTAVILADQLGAEKLGSSYGLSLFFNGLLQLIGPPICGGIYQHTGDLEPILTGLGVILIFGALLWIFAPFIERRRAQKEKMRNMNTNIDPNIDPFPSHLPITTAVDESAEFVEKPTNPDSRSETSIV